MDRITALKQERAGIIAKGMALAEKVQAENRRLTEDEIAASDTLKAEIATVDAEIAALQTFVTESAKLEEHRLDVTRTATASMREDQAEALAEKAKAGALPTPFRSLGEQLAAVAKAAQNPHAPADPRLMEIQAATGASEGVNSDGGFLVQTDFSGELIRLVHETGVLSRRTQRTTIGPNANGLRVNAIDETSRVNGSRSGGVLAYWTAEAAALTGTKPKYRQIELTLQKLTGLYYATDELLMDTTALGQEAGTEFVNEFGFKLDDAIIRGTGAGMPLGILGHAATISVSKETGQVASTIVTENIQKMYARMWARSVPRAEWFVNQDCWPQLFAMSQAVGVGGVPVFLNGSLAGAPFGTLLGRPITPIEQAESVGTVGDITFADFNEYKMIEKGGIDTAASIHVAFLTDETVFRWILRTDGQPKRNAALTPFKGTATQSSFVQLATRA